MGLLTDIFWCTFSPIYLIRLFTDIFLCTFSMMHFDALSHRYISMHFFTDIFSCISSPTDFDALSHQYILMRVLQNTWYGIDRNHMETHFKACLQFSHPVDIKWNNCHNHHIMGYQVVNGDNRQINYVLFFSKLVSRLSLIWKKCQRFGLRIGFMVEKITKPALED